LDFPLSLLAHGPGGIEYFCTEGSDFWIFSYFVWFPNRIIISFKVKNVGSKGCVPHFIHTGVNWLWLWEFWIGICAWWLCWTCWRNRTFLFRRSI